MSGKIEQKNEVISSCYNNEQVGTVDAGAD